ncbi:hypothetical protein [Mesorhizobium sp. L-2-11]|uniref:hypothetical protein n=1 Tax=Mesorhizobium sp. L-2-11 TaxID=2744521 RepID=UPI001FD59F13|nr:hypothetical protein [Mesorhizobium sp. L-2-11]
MKFAEGLVRIDVQNQVIVLLDNDAEGVDVRQKLLRLGMPSNMRAMVLPDDESFRKFPTKGHDGSSRATSTAARLQSNATWTSIF